MMTMTSPRKTSTETNRGTCADKRRAFMLTDAAAGELATLTMPTSLRRSKYFDHGLTVESVAGVTLHGFSLATGWTKGRSACRDFRLCSLLRIGKGGQKTTNNKK